MKALATLIVFLSLPVYGVDQIDPKDPKLFRGQGEVLDKKVQTPEKVAVPNAPGLYRTWNNPVKKITRPSGNGRTMKVVNPSVRNPASEQTFFKSKEWKPGKVVHLYEKSKDFDNLLNPLSLRDFNRFIYQRNPSAP